MKARQMIKACLALLLAAVYAGNSSVQARETPTTPFRLGIRDSFMIAHSFHEHPSFGPAGGMHGATYTCDVEFATTDLVPKVNWVMDIGKATDLLKQVLAKYNFKNLDEIFSNGELTTTEFMCRQIHSDLCAALRKDCPEFGGEICVKLWESHQAWASYKAALH